MGYRVLLPTAGIGSRLEGLTKYINKSLVAINHRPALCHIIEQFPDDCEFVIALGHKGKLVRDFLEMLYPERIFFFSEVNPYEGEGSGLGLSVLACKDYLQEPFVFISCDTLVKGEIKAPDHNWMAYSEGHEISQYRTLEVLDDKVLALHEKGVTRKNLKPYIGLAGVYNYQEFWQEMQKGGSEAVRVGESYGLRSLVDRKMAAYGFEWFDTGNTLALKQTRKKYETPGGPVILDKENEAIWFVGNKVIKFSDDKNFVANRVKRSESINEFVPKVIGSRENFYIYEKAEGQTVSECVTLPLFSKLLDHSKSFWQKKDLNSSEEESF